MLVLRTTLGASFVLFSAEEKDSGSNGKMLEFGGVNPTFVVSRDVTYKEEILMTGQCLLTWASARLSK